MRNERPFATGKSAVRGHGFHDFSETYAAVVTACAQPLFLPGLAHMTLHVMTCLPAWPFIRRDVLYCFSQKMFAYVSAAWKEVPAKALPSESNARLSRLIATYLIDDAKIECSQDSASTTIGSLRIMKKGIPPFLSFRLLSFQFGLRTDPGCQQRQEFFPW